MSSAKNKPFWFHSLAPREKLLIQGAQTLTDHELLALFLRTGFHGVNVMELSVRLLQEFGSIYALMSADYKSFCAKPGLGISKYAQLQAVMELSKRVLHRQIMEVCVLTNPHLTTLYLKHLFSGYEREGFVILFLDNQHRVIQSEEMFSGTINCVDVYPREIVRSALKLNAVALILAHNHPSGFAEPSSADRFLTERVVKACSLLDIRVLDHIVIGQGQSVSFAERGWL